MKKLRLLTLAGIVFTFCIATVNSLSAQTFTTLLSFNRHNGANPGSSLIQGTDGNFYGTTFKGGTIGEGTIFKITSEGVITTLYNFCSQTHCTDGANPSGLVQATDGNFYGTTFNGGTSSTCGSFGCGTVFKITQGGTLTTLYSFCSQMNCTDGRVPGNPTGLVQAGSGNFYGTTIEGGTSSACGSFGCGTVFKITRKGTLTTLHSFDGSNGADPETGLVQATSGDGSFYGITVQGGTIDEGTIYTITPEGVLTTLYNFCSKMYCADGNYPVGLVQASNGNFYGTTGGGGGG